VSSYHCTVKGSNLVKHSKAGQTVNCGQRLVKGEGLTASIDIFGFSSKFGP